MTQIRLFNRNKIFITRYLTVSLKRLDNLSRKNYNENKFISNWNIFEGLGKSCQIGKEKSKQQ